METIRINAFNSINVIDSIIAQFWNEATIEHKTVQVQFQLGFLFPFTSILFHLTFELLYLFFF